MGECRSNTEKARLFFGLLAQRRGGAGRGVRAPCNGLLPRGTAQRVVPFDHSDYYAREMGAQLVRQWVATTDLIFIPELADIKAHTNRPGGGFAEGGRRRMNIDPGYLSPAKVVLATTKDHAHRLYVGGGIFEEVTFTTTAGGYEPWPWTYPDYRSTCAGAFFLRLREYSGIKRGHYHRMTLFSSMLRAAASPLFLSRWCFWRVLHRPRASPRNHGDCRRRGARGQSAAG